ncbi:hypothetical protein PLESTM_000290600 [Pleodorina starrii]|nr:hypothetical protein PLESTM_000290600 [Pleodorina starrii]
MPGASRPPTTAALTASVAEVLERMAAVTVENFSPAVASRMSCPRSVPLLVSTCRAAAVAAVVRRAMVRREVVRRKATGVNLRRQAAAAVVRNKAGGGGSRAYGAALASWGSGGGGSREPELKRVA